MTEGINPASRSLHEPARQRVTIEEHAVLFASAVGAVKPGGSIRIYDSGNPDPRLYNNPAIMNALREAKHQKRADIRVIAGPVMIIDNESRTHGLVTLRDEGVIDESLLYPRQNDGSGIFFLLVEGANNEAIYQRWSPAPSPRVA